MTDVALNRPWFLYEMALLKGRLGQIPLLRFGRRAPENHPLSAVQDLDGFDYDSIVRLATDLLKGHDDVTRSLALQAIKQKAEGWATLIAPIQRAQAHSGGLHRAIASLSETLANEQLFKSLTSHSCMRELACRALDDVGTTFTNLLYSSGQSIFRVDYHRYPEYLVHLQKSFGFRSRTQAVALVEDVEEFWARKTGEQIMDSTSRDSQRIFVLANPTLLSKYFRNIVNHSKQYSVFVMSSAEYGLAIRHRPKGDFSIITDRQTGDQVTASYDNAAHSIQFTTDREAISTHELSFQDLLTRAHRIDPPKNWEDNDNYLEHLRNGMFATRPDDVQYHSDWIPIHRYDAFEEDHPFYREMHDRMLAEFRSRISHETEEIKVLEIGAGTGHFTKKLAQEPFGVIIKAMEPDREARALLDLKLQHKANRIQSIAASALDYDPRGEFRFVFSSFSEHHIRPEDKERYFRMLTGTMEDNGFLIVGDEFLAPHDHEDQMAYLDALEKYHRYIIDLAKNQGHFEVAALEELAWESGKPGAEVQIDHKMTLKRYVQFAVAGGLKLAGEFCISPVDLADTIGGMYVLVFQKVSSPTSEVFDLKPTSTAPRHCVKSGNGDHPGTVGRARHAGSGGP
jgi:SAM-dependent methyltransferase